MLSAGSQGAPLGLVLAGPSFCELSAYLHVHDRHAARRSGCWATVPVDCWCEQGTLWPTLKCMSYEVVSPPSATSASVSARMAATGRRDTAPEMALRRGLHAAGYRFRVIYPVPGNRRRTIDIAFTRVKVAIFVDGCFWHGCRDHCRRPRSNQAWWEQKLQQNLARDKDTDALLQEAGWHVVRIWEHESVGDALAKVRGCIDRKSLQLQA